MSRTDKTKPWRVKIAEHQPVAVHNHTDGVCNLPDDVLANPNWGGCYWDDTGLQHSDCCRQGCSCSLCWGSSRRARVRAERYAAKRAAWTVAQVGEPITGVPKKRKDTKRWCRGREGREHVLEVRWSNWAQWARSLGRTCYQEAEGTHWRAGKWTCYHEVGCARCGKVLRSTASMYDCPRWQHEHRIRLLGRPMV